MAKNGYVRIKFQNQETQTSLIGDAKLQDIEPKAENAEFLSFIPAPMMLPICVAGIYICYFTYGFLQEEIITNLKIDAVLPLLFQYVIALSVSLTINVIIDYVNRTEPESVKPMEMYVGLLNNITMLASNYALEYVDYPTQALVKSSKILPVMAFGWARGTYDHKAYKYMCAFMITVGLIVFNIAKLGSKFTDMTISAVGFGLLFVSLFFDGLLSTQSDIEKKKRKRPNAFHLMVSNNIVGILSCSVIMLYKYYTSGVNMIYEVNSQNFYSLLTIGCCSCVGQIFIYTTISRFDGFLLSVVNTSRKFFSILFSIVWFGHHIGWLHWVGIIIVIGAIVCDVVISESDRRMNNALKASENGKVKAE
jgi:UDP-galactose transporter B1